MSNYLAIQTSFLPEELVIQIEENPFFHKFSESEKPAENLARITSEILSKNNLQINNLNYVIVTTGPGSFTGLRIGIAYAKSLVQFNKNIKLIGLNLLEVAKWKFGKNAFLDARNNRSFILEDDKLIVKNNSEIENFESYQNANVLNVIDLINYVKNNEVSEVTKFYEFLPEYVIEPRIG